MSKLNFLGKKINEKSQIIYYVTVDDIQDIAKDKLGRKLNTSELQNVKKEVWDKFDSYEPISLGIDKLNIS